MLVAAAGAWLVLRPGGAPTDDATPGGAAPTATPRAPITPAAEPVGPCTHPVTATAPLERLGGDGPAASAACAAFRSFTAGSPRAIVATGTLEGLVAAPLARQLEAPVLLVGRDDLPGETVTALRDLDVSEITVVGEASDRLVAALEELATVTDQLAGNVTELSVAVAERTSPGATLYVAPAERPHLLLAAAAAVREGTAVVALEGAAPPAVVDLAAGRDEVRLVGHPSALPEAAVAAFRDVAPVVRIDGADVAGTAAGLARRQSPGDGPLKLVDTRAVDHAVSAAWIDPDAPLLLVDQQLPAATRRWLLLDAAEPGRGVRLFASEVSEPLVADLDAVAADVADGPPAPQVRGAWAHLFDESLKTRDGITTFLDTAVESGLNTVIVQVARRQDAYYTSEVLPRTTDPALEPGLDVLAELVPRAHARGLDVHAWFAVAQSWHRVYEDLPPPEGWVWRDHGPDSAEPWVTRPHPDRASSLGYPDAYETYPYLDLGVPAVRDHIVATLIEVAERYAVDAIHLDYLRYPGKEWGYHPVSLRRFADETGAGIDPPPAPDDAAWSRWRREQATSLAGRIHDELAAVRPDLEVSAAVIAQGDGPTASRPFSATIAYDDKMQDWVGWTREGYLDLTIPMAYFDERRYATRYDQWVGLARALTADGARVAIGQASWLNPTALSLSQAQDALRDTDGLVLYSYQQDTWCPAGTTETGDPCSPVEPPRTLWRQLAEGPFAEPAPPR
ncbi:MAG: family 10 glycosylhydrolase [Nitriliruptorales bacterium]|nr:family 10 glycosylhydrolase [Nitriliruptorales bacterium]